MRSDERIQNEDNGFALIELLAILAVMFLLAALLMPAMAGAKVDTWRAQCQSNMKQLGNGFSLFEQDHDGMLPPAALTTGAQAGVSGVLAWDCYLYRYIGGTAADRWLTSGVIPFEWTVWRGD